MNIAKALEEGTSVWIPPLKSENPSFCKVPHGCEQHMNKYLVYGHCVKVELTKCCKPEGIAYTCKTRRRKSDDFYKAF